MSENFSMSDDLVSGVSKKFRHLFSSRTRACSLVFKISFILYRVPNQTKIRPINIDILLSFFKYLYTCFEY